MGISACHSPEDFNPTVERNIINNLTASFPDDDSDDNSFTSEIDYTNHVITVVFPYNYPKLSDNVLQLSDLKKMRVIADLDNNVYVYPTLLFMDGKRIGNASISDEISDFFCNFINKEYKEIFIQKVDDLRLIAKEKNVNIEHEKWLIEMYSLYK